MSKLREDYQHTSADAARTWHWLNPRPTVHGRSNTRRHAYMVENQHRKIVGYRELTPHEIALMNAIKACEASAAGVLEDVRKALTDGGTIYPSSLEYVESMRQVALAREALEVGFMHLVRAVARPVTPWGVPKSVKHIPKETNNNPLGS